MVNEATFREIPFPLSGNYKLLYRTYLKKICGPGENNRTFGPGQKEFEQCG